MLTNGHLLAAADSAGFDLLVTLDRGFLHQHNMSGRRIAVAVLIIETQSIPGFLAAIKKLSAQLESLPAGTITSIQ